MGRGRVLPSTSIDAQELHRFFDEKIAGVRNSIADAPPCTVLRVCAIWLRLLDVPRPHRRRRHRRRSQAT